MSIKLLKRLSCGIISGVCCCLFCLLLATAANADVCFLPTGQCEAASANLSAGCSGFNLTSAKDETGWNCTQCGEKWKCEKKSCKDDYKTDVRCSGTETKVCDETRKAGDESCCRCEDSVTKCQHEGYVYKKTSTNENCTGECPYNSDYYESCECNAKYDKSSNTNACYTYNTCELGDLAGTKKYEQASDAHKCKAYIDNSAYVTDNSEQVKSDDYDCTLVCTETCDNSNRKYYQCSPKKNCKGGEGMYETEADCKKAYKIASNNSSFERVWAMIMKNITPINQAFAGCPCPTSGPGSGKEYGKDNNGRTLYYSLSPCCQANAIVDSDKIDEALVDGGIKIEDPVYSCKYDEGTKCWYAVVGDADPCANGPYSWRDTECCAKDKWKDTVYCKKPTCTITAGDKKFTDLIYPYEVTDFVPKVCDDRLKEGLGIGNLQYGCSSGNTNYVLGMIRYCGGINDFAGIDDMNALAAGMYGRDITNNAGPGVYASCEIPATALPQYSGGFTGSAGGTPLYNKIKSYATGRLDDFWINVRECYNGDECGLVRFHFTNYKYGVFDAPVLSSNPYNRGMCVCRDEEGCTPKTCPTGTLRETDWQYMIDHGINSYNCWEEADIDDGCGGKIKCFSNKCSDGTCYKSYSDIPTEYQNGNYTTLIHGYCVRNSKVTVYYDAPTNCNAPMRLTHQSSGVTIMTAATTNNVPAGTYTISPSSGSIQSYTIRMGRGGTPSTKTGTTTYTFSAGNEYWIVPNCSSGGGCQNNSDCNGGAHTACGIRWTACMEMTSNAYSYCMGQAGQSSMMQGACSGMYAANKATCNNYKNYECMICQSGACLPDPVEPNWSSRLQHYSN